MSKRQAQGMQAAASVGKRMSALVPGIVKRHKYMSAAAGMATAGGIASGRRRSGLDRVEGRPTGMRQY
jgi:hypothetical protein